MPHAPDDEDEEERRRERRMTATLADLFRYERMFDAGTRWTDGQRIIGFRRWKGLDDRWHAILVLEDKTRLVLDEP